MKNTINSVGSSESHLLSYLMKISFGPQGLAVSKDIFFCLPQKKKDDYQCSLSHRHKISNSTCVFVPNVQHCYLKKQFI